MTELQEPANDLLTDSETRPADRSPAGQFVAGNQAARRHGARAFEDHGAAVLPPELRDELAAFRSGVETDQGGADELTTIGTGYVRRLAEVEAILRLLGTDLQTRGLFTKRGRVRSTYHAYMLAVDRWDRLAQRLGLARRAKPVPTLTEYLRGRYGPEPEPHASDVTQHEADPPDNSQLTGAVDRRSGASDPLARAPRNSQPSAEDDAIVEHDRNAALVPGHRSDNDPDQPRFQEE